MNARYSVVLSQILFGRQFSILLQGVLKGDLCPLCFEAMLDSYLPNILDKEDGHFSCVFCWFLPLWMDRFATPITLVDDEILIVDDLNGGQCSQLGGHHPRLLSATISFHSSGPDLGFSV